MALGRALVREPQVFLMDEPLSNLDAKLRTQTRGEIRRLQQEVRTTTVYVTHDQVEAMTMGDRIAVMNDGRARAGRHARGALRAPREPLRRRLHRLARDGVLRAGVVDVALHAAAQPGAVVGRAARARAAVARRADRAAAGTVAFVEALGRETFVGVDVGEARLVVFEEGRATRDVGDEIEFGLVESGLRYFSTESGAAL